MLEENGAKAIIFYALKRKRNAWAFCSQVLFMGDFIGRDWHEAGKRFL